MECPVSRRRPLLLFLLGILLPAAALAQEGGAVQVLASDAASPERLEFLVQVPPGAPTTDPGEFELLEDGRQTGRASSLNTFRTSGWTLATVLAVDTSGSVRRHISAMGSALPEYLSTHPAEDAFALVTFDDEVELRAPFGAPRSQVEDSLTTLSASGRRTLLYSALDRSMAAFTAVPRARVWRRIVVLSDGADESTDQPNALDAVINDALMAGISIDTVWIGQPVASTRNTLVRLAERTGGIHSDVTDLSRVEDELRAALARGTARVDEAMVVAFDRRIQPGTTTAQIGVRLARPGVAPALLAMQVPQSAPALPTDAPANRLPTLQLVTRILLGLALAIFGYAAIKVFVFKQPLREALFLQRKIIEISLEAPPPPPPPPPARRHTMVGPPAPFAGAAATTLVLEGVEGPLVGHRILVQGSRFQIGAAKGNDLQIAADKYLSSVHAVLQPSKNGWLVVDKESSNGTFVDGRKVSTGGHELRDGERLRVGGSEFRVVLGTATSAAASSSPAEAAPR